jgi:hypothetical protein
MKMRTEMQTGHHQGVKIATVPSQRIGSFPGRRVRGQIREGGPCSWKAHTGYLASMAEAYGVRCRADAL